MIKVGIISFENYKLRAIAIAKGYKVPHPDIKFYRVRRDLAPLGSQCIDLNKLPIYEEIK